MSTDSANLDRLHDIVLPQAVSWWPLAPGWYVILVLLLVVCGCLGYRYWRRWQTNAYRREALQELADMKDSPAIAELLRRTALAIVPRSDVAQKTDFVWTEWLAAQCSYPMPSKVRHLLAAGVYDQHETDGDFELLKGYAIQWVKNHQLHN
jgi:hypothetical protein